MAVTTAGACARCGRPTRPPKAKSKNSGTPTPPQPTTESEPPDPGQPGVSLGHGTRRRQTVVAVRRWPEGLICSGCFARACETYGHCPGCGTDRLLPGLDADGRPVCTDCAGGLGDYTCIRCGQEGWRQEAGVCGRCVLTDRLAAVLDDGTGQVRPELIPFYDALRAMDRPRSGILWLSKPHVPPILRALATGGVPLTHDGLAALSPPKSVTHVRDLLVSCGVLPPVDRFLLAFQQWLPGWLASIPDPDHARILTRYATWHVLRRLRRVAEHQPIGPYRDTGARNQLRVAAAFLTHLDRASRSLGECRQADLDRWLAQAASHEQHQLRAFLGWAATSHEAPKLAMPPWTRSSAHPVGHQQRLELLRRVLEGTGMTSTDRVVVMLILLYAQPLNRIAQLTLDDIDIREDGPEGPAVFVHLGDPPAPIPAPFDAVLLEHLANRTNLTTATNPGSGLLFPGRRAGQPIHPGTLRARLQALGIPNLNGRSQTIRDLLRQAPASIVASMLGYHPLAAERIATETAAGWARYSATRSRNCR